MNVNYTSNSHPAAAAGAPPQYNSHVQPLAPSLADASEDRRVIIIHEGVLALNPAVYLADRLYQAFLMYNHKLVLCECFSDADLLDHCLRHLIHAWCAAMKVMFIQEDAFLNQSQASLADVAQATTQWLAAFAEKNLSSRNIQSGLGKMPSDGLAAPSPLATPPNHPMDALSGTVIVNSKRRYPSKPKPVGDTRKRKATGSTTTTKTKTIVSIKPQSKTPRKPAQSKKGKGAAMKKSLLNKAASPLPTTIKDDDALLPKCNDDFDNALMKGQEAVSGSQSLLSPTPVNPNSTVTSSMPVTETGGGTAMTATPAAALLEPLDKNDFDSHVLDIPDDYLEFLLPEYSALSSAGLGGGDSNTMAVLSPPPPTDDAQEEEEEERDATTTSTTTTMMTELHDDDNYSELAVGAHEFLDHPFFVTPEDVDAFMNKEMPPLLMTSEDSADSADEHLNNMEYSM